MTKLFSILMGFLLFFSCTTDEITDNETNSEPNTELDYKQEMRNFVIGISEYAKAINPNFSIIPQNGVELVTVDGTDNGASHTAYLNAIDGHGQEDLFYGYDTDDDASPTIENAYLRTFLDISKNTGNTILVTDYCSTPSKMDDSYTKNSTNGYISFAADERELFNIPTYPNPIVGENTDNISQLSTISNFLYLINPQNFATKTDFINAVTATNYDLIIMDLFFHDDTEFTAAEITQLKSKSNGGSRLIISYMSIGEAEDYRYYWDNSWTTNSPAWLDQENPAWEGNIKVKYWEEAWQNIIFGNNDSYLKKITDAHFDGVYLDIIDGFEYYENL